MDVKTVLNFVFTNWEEIIGVIAVVISLVKLTAWGKAKSDALDTTIRAVESAKAIDVKELMRTVDPVLPDSVHNAIVNSVNKEDPRKTVDPLVKRLGVELLQGIIKARLEHKE